MGDLSSSMYLWMIVYCISSALGFLIAQKVMTQRTCIILNNMPRLQPRSKATAWPARLGIGSVNTAMDLGEYWLVLKSNLVLTISEGHRWDSTLLDLLPPPSSLGHTRFTLTAA